MAKQYVLSEQDLYHIRIDLASLKVYIGDESCHWSRFIDRIEKHIINKGVDIPVNDIGLPTGDNEPPVTIVLESKDSCKVETFRDKLRRGVLSGSEIVSITNK